MKLRPIRVTLCFDNHADDGHVWAVRVGRIWHRVSAVDCRVPMRTVYKGKGARQPKAYLTGTARAVLIERGMARIQD